MTLIPLPHSGLLALADCYAYTGRIEPALFAYESLLGRQNVPPQVYAAIYRGLIYCERRDLALDCCRAAVLANPEDHAAYYAMAFCMVALGYSATYVAAVLERAVEEAPDRDVYRVSLAMQLTRCGRPDEAYTQLSKASPTAIEAMACRCSVKRLLELCLWTGDHTRSRLLSERLSKLSPCDRAEG